MRSPLSQVRFVIIAQARSGSTLLRLALHAHPDVVCHGEVLSAAWMNRLVPQGQKAVDQSPKDQILRLWDERENDPGQFLERWVYSGFSQSCIGFKVVYGDLLMHAPRRSGSCLFHVIHAAYHSFDSAR